MLNILQSRKVANSAQPLSYREACIAACQTVEGATALAAKLRRLHDAAPLNSFDTRSKLSRQVEVAEKVARRRAIEKELLERIPATCKRDEESATLALTAATGDAKRAEERVGVAQERIARFTASALAKRQSCDQVAAAATSKVAAAEVALQAARDHEDPGAMARASEFLVKERQSAIAAQDSNSAALLEATSFSELADKARNELAAAQSDLDEAKQRQLESRMALLALEEDRHTLAALLAHVRWWVTNSSSAKKAVWPASFDHAKFFFHKGERAIKWDGKPGSHLACDLAGFGGLSSVFVEPEWSRFDTDPIAAADGASHLAGQ